MIKNIVIVLLFSMILMTSGMILTEATITQIDFYIDGQKRYGHTENGALIEANFDWSTYSERTGWHTISATSYSNDGRNAHDAIVVLVEKRLP